MPGLLMADAADNFRVSVGRYGDRWYCDPLPACDLMPATDATWPSVSTVKKASGSDWSYVAMRRCAADLAAHPQRYVGMDAEQLYAAFQNANKDGLGKAAARGTAVHAMCEQLLLTGRITDEGCAPEYRAAVEHFFDTYQPERHVVEAVAIHRDLNGTGYGGTGDAGLIIGGQLIKVDWKSRGEDSKHGAYPEEAAQIAAYARAQYVIELGMNGDAVRTAVPAYAEGWVVSIRPDGARVYPVDLDKAWEHWTRMHAWWVARRSERDAIGRVLPARAAKAKAPSAPKAEQVTIVGQVIHAGSACSTPQPAPTLELEPTKREWLIDRIRQLRAIDPGAPERVAALLPAGITPLGGKALLTRADFDLYDQAIMAVERATEAPFVPGGAEPWTPPAEPVAPERPEPRTFDEGDPIDDETAEAMRRRMGELAGSDGEAWARAVLREAKDAGVPISLRATQTERMFMVTRAVHAWADAFGDDELARCGLVHVLGDDRVQPGFPTGAVIGALSIGEAGTFAETAWIVERGHLVYVVDAQGARLEPAN